MDVQKNTVTVITKEGEFRRLPRRGQVEVGDDYSCSTFSGAYIVAASLALLVMSSVVLSSLNSPVPLVRPDRSGEPSRIIVAEPERGEEQVPTQPATEPGNPTGPEAPPAGGNVNNNGGGTAQPPAAPRPPATPAAPDNTDPPAAPDITEPPATPAEPPASPGGPAQEQPAVTEPADPPIMVAEEPVFEEANRFNFLEWEWLMQLLFSNDVKQ